MGRQNRCNSGLLIGFWGLAAVMTHRHGGGGRAISAIGPPLPTCAVHKVVGYLRYCGRASRTAAIAVFDP